MLKTKAIFILCLGLFSGLTFAQKDNGLQEAFSNSYTLEESGDYSGAVAALKAVYDEESYALNLRLGWLSYMGGMFTESSAYYQKAILLKPLSLEAKFGLVYPAATVGNWEQVKKQYADVLTIDPQNTTANYRLGSIYYGNGEYQRAMLYLEKVVNLYPFDYDALVMFGWTHFQLGKFREAEVLFKQALLNQPQGQSALEGLEALEK